MGALIKKDSYYVHKNNGVCSSAVQFEIENGRLKNTTFIGGCAGNTSGICRLVEGMEVQEVIHRLKGIHCGPRPTSCPDQLAKALQAYLNEAAK